MSHIDPEVLALLALGEDEGTPADHAHLAECGPCRAELANLAHAAKVGRSSLDAGALLDPDPRVWAGIQAELADAPATAPVTPIAPRRRRWLAPVAGAAAALLVGAGLAVSWWELQPAPTTVLATATLDAFPDWPGATGSAIVEERPDGSRVVDVSIDAPVSTGAYREVWLISSTGSELVSLGVVDGGSGRFTIPDGLDLTRFDLVDVSEEPLDGDPAHSGDSIVRGQLSSGA